MAINRAGRPWTFWSNDLRTSLSRRGTRFQAGDYAILIGDDEGRFVGRVGQLVLVCAYSKMGGKISIQFRDGRMAYIENRLLRPTLSEAERNLDVALAYQQELRPAALSARLPNEAEQDDDWEESVERIDGTEWDVIDDRQNSLGLHCEIREGQEPLKAKPHTRPG